MKVGVTATREGTTQKQRYYLRCLLDLGTVKELHHGGCDGGDTDAVTIALDRVDKIVLHPPTSFYRQNDSARKNSHEIREPKSFLERNKGIVNETEKLFAMPRGPEEVRSGTWQTVRYARTLKRHIVIFWPDGEITEENKPEKEPGTSI